MGWSTCSSFPGVVQFVYTVVQHFKVSTRWCLLGWSTCSSFPGVVQFVYTVVQYFKVSVLGLYIEISFSTTPTEAYRLCTRMVFAPDGVS